MDAAIRCVFDPMSTSTLPPPAPPPLPLPFPPYLLPEERGSALALHAFKLAQLPGTSQQSQRYITTVCTTSHVASYCSGETAALQGS